MRDDDEGYDYDQKPRVRIHGSGYERSETEAQINEAAVVDTIMYLR